MDKADPSIPLEGATFDLYANDEKVDTQTTDKNGVIEFDDLVYGDYTLKRSECTRRIHITNRFDREYPSEVRARRKSRSSHE